MSNKSTQPAPDSAEFAAELETHFSALMTRLTGTAMEIDEAAQKNLLGYLRLLSNYNQKVNLVGNCDPYSLVERHALDGLTLLPVIRAEMARSKSPNQRQRYLDIGTGGGLPGMVVAICAPLLATTLMDATLKKCNFLQFAIDELGLEEQIEVVNGRAEEGARENQLRERYKFVTARAVGTLKLTTELAIPYLKPGGLFIAQKTTSRLDSELKEAKELLHNIGAEVEHDGIEQLDFPELKEALIVPVRKKNPTPNKFPREWKLIAPK
jgi:16S rRNA (guanine527-N7)-methyltransferase